MVRWHGSLKPHSHYRLLHGVDKAVDWDFELLEIDDAQLLVPAPFLPNSVRLRPFAPRCIRPLWRVQKPPRLRKLPIRSPLALEPVSDGQAHDEDEEDNPPAMMQKMKVSMTTTASRAPMSQLSRPSVTEFGKPTLRKHGCMRTAVKEKMMV